jgi:hypothetical protein
VPARQVREAPLDLDAEPVSELERGEERAVGQRRPHARDERTSLDREPTR